MAQALLPPPNPCNLTLLSSFPSKVKLFSSHEFQSQSQISSIRKLRSLVFQASKDDVGVMNSDVSPTSSSNPLFSLINEPSWVTWLSGALVVLSVPFYRRIRKAQDRAEEMVEKVADEMENVAEKVEKITSEMAETLPEGTLKEMVLKVEKTADAVEKSAEKAQSLIEKLDKIESEIDELVEPLAKQEAALKEKDEGKQA